MEHIKNIDTKSRYTKQTGDVTLDENVLLGSFIGKRLITVPFYDPA